MNISELLEKYFDVAFAAPDGIKKLRELILSLAMQGKLVPQDSNDQPARELLQEIEKEKERLVKEGKIKQSKPLPEIKPDEVTYDLPKGWEWSRLGEIIFLLGDGIHGTPIYDETGDYFFINGNNLSDGVIEVKENTKKVSINEYQKYKKELNSRTVLVSINGTIGNVAFYNNERVILGKSACYFNLFEQIDKQFTKRLLNSKYFLEYAFASATGSTIKNVSLKSMREFMFPLPPLAEQRRIVAKIDKLMGRCDELEKLRSDRTQKQITVHTAALDRLLKATEQNDFNTAWQFLTQHFSELYSTKANLTELRKAILQLAVMGKLVPQDPLDRPASELLKEIEAEKNRLIKEGKIKYQTLLPDIREMPYVLPIGWQWVKFEDIVEISSGVTKGRKLNGKEIVLLPYLRVANVQRSYLDLDVIKVIEIAKDEIERFELKKRDLLITEGGDWDKVGRATIWNNEIPHCVHQNHIFKARCLLSKQNEKWLEKYLNSSVARAYFANASKQTTNLASINKTQLRGCPIPIPPLAEQHRIVAKINQLMTLCDNLEKQIDTAISKQTNLLNALMTKI